MEKWKQIVIYENIKKSDKINSAGHVRYVERNRLMIDHKRIFNI